jgi:GT2 family glycosyltransferase
VCTHDRSGDLARALASLTAQQAGSPEFEIVVVDNGSTDDTRQVVAEFESRCSVNYLFEPRLGLCHARNRGGQSARGRFIAYLDDDAVACSSWVTAIVKAFELCPDAGVVGGRVDPVWGSAKPRWLSDHVARALTIVDWCPHPKVLSDLSDEWLVGANMAIRRDVLQRIGGFRPELDRVGSRMLSSGDIFLLKQVIRAGSVCFYYPPMAVHHAVPASRLTKRWFRCRYYWQGVSNAVMELLEQRPDISERRRWAWRALTQLASAKRLWTLLPTSDPRRFAETCWTLIAIGHLAGLAGVARVQPTVESPRQA